MMMPPMANLTCAITNGCATAKPILVAEEADAHRNANPTPAAIHLYCLLILFHFNFFKYKNTAFVIGKNLCYKEK
jgi:hypothetical protein